MGCCSSRRIGPMPTEPAEGRSEWAEFERLVAEDLAPGNTHGWNVKVDWPAEYKDDFKMRVALREHVESESPNLLLRADGKFRGVKPEHMLAYLLEPSNLPGLQEWKDVADVEGGYIKYCRVKAPGCKPRDHCWRYTIDKRDDGSIFVCIRTTKHEECPEQPSAIRAYFYNASVFRPSGEEEGVTEMTEFVLNELGGAIPVGMMNSALPSGTIKTNANEMKWFKEKGYFVAPSKGGE